MSAGMVSGNPDLHTGNKAKISETVNEINGSCILDDGKIFIFMSSPFRQFRRAEVGLLGGHFKPQITVDVERPARCTRFGQNIPAAKAFFNPNSDGTSFLDTIHFIYRVRFAAKIIIKRKNGNFLYLFGDFRDSLFLVFSDSHISFPPFLVSGVAPAQGGGLISCL